MKIAAILAALMLSACVTTQYGNYSTAADEGQRQIADDAIVQMTKTFPPGKLNLVFSQKTDDTFGTAFVNGLRQSGYAIEEHVPDAAHQTDNKTSPSAGTTTVAYMVDDVDNDIIRLTIMVGQHAMSRPYARQADSNYAPVGSWTLKE